MSDNDKTQGEFPPLARWILVCFDKNTWKKHPFVALVTVVIIICVPTVAIFSFSRTLTLPNNKESISVSFSTETSLRGAIKIVAEVSMKAVEFNSSCQSKWLDQTIVQARQIKASSAKQLIEALHPRLQVLSESGSGKMEVLCNES